jgi:hypothetical protein
VVSHVSPSSTYWYLESAPELLSLATQRLERTLVDIDFENPNQTKDGFMILRVGSRLKSLACDTEVMVIRAPAGDVEVTCGGAPMTLDTNGERVDLDDSQAEGTLLGKRYVDDAGEVELLCVKSGKGSLQLGGAALQLKDAKALPASD